MKRQSTQSRPTRRHRTPKEIAGILREHRRSRLLLLAFARTHGLCYASLLRWRSRQRKGASVLVSSDTQVDPRFVSVKIDDEVLSEDYVLSWPCGRSRLTAAYFRVIVIADIAARSHPLPTFDPEGQSVSSKWLWPALGVAVW